MLGDHRLLFSFGLYRDLENSDFLVSYSFLKNRINYGFGAFQFKNYLNSRMSTIGEGFADYRLFSERNYGVYGIMSIPFSTFSRLDLELQALVSDREFFYNAARDMYGNPIFVPQEESRRRLIEPAISFTHDASFYSYFGPVEGSRYTMQLSKGLGFGSNNDVSRTTAFIDYRWYKTLFYRNSFAFRLTGGFSEGKDPRVFFLGGPTTLRGYDYQRFYGTRMGLMSLEYRFPMLDALIFGWPGRWGFTNIGGTVFYDAGSAWDRNTFNPFVSGGGLQYRDIKADYGFGAYLNLGYFLVNLQFAWPTDMRYTGDMEFYLWFGPSF
jgi:outer membrane protein assembly factor BamA